MATIFKSQSGSPIETLRLLNQLIPEHSGFSPSSGCESWRCAFAPNDGLFAWSVGNCIVSLVPWFNNSAQKESENDVKSSVIIDCGHLVRSLTFASIPNINKSTAFWPRAASRKDLFLVTGHTNGRIRIWDVVSGKLLLQLLDHKDAVSDVSFIPNEKGLIVSTSFDGCVKIWDLMEDGNLHKTLKIDGTPVYGCCVSPDSNSMVTVGMSKIVSVWETENFSIRLRLIGHQHNVVACCFSPDGCLIATASWDTSVIIWDSKYGNNLRQFCHMNPPPRMIFAAGDNGNFIRALSFSSDGYHVATVADDGFLRIWDLLNESEPEAVGTITDGLCCSYSNSGRVLAVGTRNGSVSIFEGRNCTKSLLFLCRLAIKRHFPSQEFNSNIIPKRLIHYLQYKEWD